MPGEIEAERVELLFRRLGHNPRMGLDRKVRALLEVIPPLSPRGSLLVVGCGSGREAGILARELSLRALGIDVELAAFAIEEAAPAALVRMDARRLAIADASVEFVYSFHALEHILPPVHALQEMHRVLVAGGGFLIGAPNQRRLVGYIGAPATLYEKFRWNVSDWNRRLRGQFRNELGAHAGFSERALLDMCTALLGPAEPVSGRYYCALYSRHAQLISFLSRTGLARWTFPSVYVLGTKPPTEVKERGGDSGVAGPEPPPAR